MAEQVLIPLQDILERHGSVLVGWALDEAAEELIPVCHAMDMAVIRNWGDQPSVSPGNAKRVLAHLRGQVDPAANREDPAGQPAKAGMIRGLFGGAIRAGG